MTRILDGRRALVVGGSDGIGACISNELARRGADLLIHGGHSPERLEAVIDKARSFGVHATGTLLEFGTDPQAEALLAEAGSVDILVVAFGPYLENPVARMSASDWARIVNLNLTLPAVLISAALKDMVERQFGRIVVFGAPRSDRQVGYRQIAAYAAAKSGLASLVRSVALQCAGDNIRCNMICPGFVDTDNQSKKNRQTAANQSVGRLIDPDEIAELAMTLLQPTPHAINGAVIPVDFGL